MRKFFAATLLLIALQWWGHHAVAEDLLSACNSAPGTSGDSICNSYVNGYVNGILGDQVARENGAPICIPNGTTTPQVREVVRHFLSVHPADRVLNLGGVVAVALSDAYPCKKPN